MRKHTILAGMFILGAGLFVLPGILSRTETPYVQAAAMVEDNPFTVPVIEVLAFQEQIREAVEQEDLSALKNFCSFPLRVGPNGEHLLVSGDDLMLKDPENIFTGALKSALEEAKDNTPVPGVDGFTFGSPETFIRFRPVDGALKITEIICGETHIIHPRKE